MPKKDRKTPLKGSETQAQLLIVWAGYGGDLEERFQRMLKRVVEAQEDYGEWATANTEAVEAGNGRGLNPVESARFAHG